MEASENCTKVTHVAASISNSSQLVGSVSVEHSGFEWDPAQNRTDETATETWTRRTHGSILPVTSRALHHGATQFVKALTAGTPPHIVLVDVCDVLEAALQHGPDGNACRRQLQQFILAKDVFSWPPPLRPPQSSGAAPPGILGVLDNMPVHMILPLKACALAWLPDLVVEFATLLAKSINIVACCVLWQSIDQLRLHSILPLAMALLCLCKRRSLD